MTAAEVIACCNKRCMPESPDDATEQERTFIRINVSDFDEAVEFFKSRGFRMARHEAADKTIETGSSKFNIMVSPSGFIMSVSQHIKE